MGRMNNWLTFSLVILAVISVLLSLGAKGCPWWAEDDDDETTSGSSGALPWTAITTVGAPSLRSGYTAIWTGNEMIIWGGLDQEPPKTGILNTGAKYNSITDTWTPITMTNAPSTRTYHTAVWTGTEMIIWGGMGHGGNNLNTGAKYNPSTDTWTPITTTGAASQRRDHSAVWTGTPAEGGTGEMLIWGGYNSGYLNTGAKYNPSLDTWAVITTTGAPSERKYHSAVWTGTEMIIWGGHGIGYFDDGAKYNPSTNTWSPVTSGPIIITKYGTIWTGIEMVVWGKGSGRYNPVSDTWTSITGTGAPPERSEHSAVWTGSEMIIWGGGSGGYYNDGGRYNPLTDTWILIPSSEVLKPRWEHTAVWTGTEMIIWGGGNINLEPAVYYNDGARYKP